MRLVFVMAFAMPEGSQLIAGGVQMPEWMKLDLEVGLDIFHLNTAFDRSAARSGWPRC